MIITDQQELEFQEARKCWICEERFPNKKLHEWCIDTNDFCVQCENQKEFDRRKILNCTEPYLHCHNRTETNKNCSRCKYNENIKVRDHCHRTGVYRGPAHRSCNLNYNVKPSTWSLKVLFHNFRGYDSHLLIKALQKRHGTPQIIATNFEKYLAVRIRRVQFLDSMQFCMSGMSALADSMKDEDFKNLKSVFSGENGRGKTMHCHNKSENNENCELCKENASLDICEQFGVEQYTYHCHQENESEENCSWCEQEKGKVSSFETERSILL